MSKTPVDILKEKPAAYRLNVGESFIALSIKNANERIAQLNATKEKFMPEYMEKKTFYDQVKAEFMSLQTQMDGIDGEIAQQEGLINVYKNFKKGGAGNQVNGTPVYVASTPMKREEGFVKRIDWIALAAEELRKEGKFMNVNAVYSRIVKRSDVKEHIKLLVTGSDEALLERHNSKRLIEHAVRATEEHAVRATEEHGKPKGKVRSGRKFLGKLILYKEKMGLPEWLDNKTLQPIAAHLQEFMFN